MPEDVISIVDAAIEADNDTCYKADSLEELAELIGVPADALTASVERYNGLVESGSDEDFHKQADFLYPVVKAPFYAAKVGVALLAVVGGLSVNTDLQVLDDEKKPIEGLYATGNTSGDLYAIDYPINMAGNSNGRCVIWGYLLGRIISGAEDIKAEAVPTAKAEVAEEKGTEAAAPTVASDAMKDGSYTGVGKGIGGTVPVTVTIEGGNDHGRRGGRERRDREHRLQGHRAAARQDRRGQRHRRRRRRERRERDLQGHLHRRSGRPGPGQRVRDERRAREALPTSLMVL